ncbi:DUF3576 domain-containing protein [Pelagibacteraceae bacterium]|nr:DUF3576 domain-containing protein [Pelagibacteraceae bacterium]|tara:strand:+ start:117 stop:701 length:585 start_codon:yes stop_codon:yes gene_type:complete
MNLKKNIRKLTLFLGFIFLVLSLSQCGIYRKTDARKIPGNADERVKKNMEEGRRIKFGGKDGIGGGTGTFDFATSNELWRATIDILDFVPLNNADYGGGIIITDWYNNSESNNTSIKIMVQFLSNEIRADGLKVLVYNKNCKTIDQVTNCKTNTSEGEVANEIKNAILKKATILKKTKTEKQVKEFKKKRGITE